MTAEEWAEIFRAGWEATIDRGPDANVLGFALQAMETQAKLIALRQG